MRGSRRRRPELRVAAWAVAPLAIVCALFLVLPLLGMVVSALTDPTARTFTLDNFASVFSGLNLRAIQNSLLVSAVSSAIAAVVGAIIAVAITRVRSAVVDAVVPVLSSVLANSGGVPLAFSFIVILGNVGTLTALLRLEDVGFSLYSWQGLVVMYQYFLIPTMVLVTLPAIASIRTDWKRASAALGAGALTFWVRVGLPLLAPSLLGGWTLLFGAAFATHASAAVLLSTGAFPLVPLTIAGNLSGGAASGREGAGMALGVVMSVVAVVCLLVSEGLQRRSMRWLG